MRIFAVALENQAEEIVNLVKAKRADALPFTFVTHVIQM